MKNKVILFSFLSLIYACRLQAQAGILDNSFGTGGKTASIVGSGNSAIWSTAIQADWSIVMGGFAYNGTDSDFALVRYLPDGTLDDNFGTEGIVLTDFGSGSDVIFSVAIQQDGKILAGGMAWNGSDFDFAAARYNTDGSLDNSFGTNGKLTTAIGSGNDKGKSLKIQADWSIVLGGTANTGSGNDFALVRYLSDGTLDNTFGTNGKVTTPVMSDNDMGFSLAIQSDWSIVLGGTAFNGTDFDFALARFTATGTLDNSFGNNGKVITQLSGYKDFIWSVDVQPDGKILAAGYGSPDSLHKDIGLVRYNSDGSLDNTFGNNGKVLTALSNGDDDAYSVILQPDGKIIAGGFSADNNDVEHYALVRYNTDGTVDNTFGISGKVITTMSTGRNEIYSMALQPDGKIVAAGFSTDSTGVYFSAARYLTDLNLGVIDLSASGNAILIYPNPVAQNAVLEYILTKEETVTIRLVNMEGKVVKTFAENQKQASGAHKQPLSLGSELASGTYYIVISTPGGKLSIKLVK